MDWCKPNYIGNGCDGWVCVNCRRSLYHHCFEWNPNITCHSFVFHYHDNCTIECQFNYKIQEATSSLLWMAIFQ